jgi:hypothetical protein
MGSGVAASLLKLFDVCPCRQAPHTGRWSMQCCLLVPTGMLSHQHCVGLAYPSPFSPPPCAHTRELKARAEELAAQVAGGGSSAELEARLTAAEARGRALSAALGRKEAALAAAQGRLESATRRAEEAGAAGGASASELERQVRMVARLRGEAARKEGLLAVSEGGGGGAGMVAQHTIPTSPR